MNKASRLILSPNVYNAPLKEGQAAVTRVLLLEDEEVYFKLLKRVMESITERTFEISWAANLRDGLEFLSNRTFDLILLDLTLPDSSGLETFRRVRELANGSPVLILSANNDEQKAMEAVYSGAQDFLIKGRVGIEAIIRCIRHTLARLEVSEYRERLQAITDFTAALAHDLRGPIIGAERVLSGMLAQVDSQSLSAEQLSMLKCLQKNNDFLRRKVDALLEIYKLESNRTDIDMEVVDLGALVKVCIRALGAGKQQSRTRRIVFRKRGSSEVMGNRHSLIQLVTNLLDNAIRYSETNELVEVRLTQQRKNIRLTVRDNGRGMSPDEVRSLFKRFWRGGNHKFVPGTGLGLYLCEKIVRAHHGSINCQSNLGTGSVFSIVLPAYIQTEKESFVSANLNRSNATLINQKCFHQVITNVDSML